MRKRSIFSILLLLFLAGAAHAQAQMYRWVDKDGKAMVGKQPPAGVKAEPVTVQASPGKGVQAGPRLGPGQGSAAAQVNDPNADETQKRAAQPR